MAHSVQVTPRAYDEIDGIVGYIAQDSLAAALRWRASILKKIDSLKHFPLRHGLAPEAEAIGVDVRQAIHGAYRILYVVEGDAVTVHGVRHGARRPLRPDELPGQAYRPALLRRQIVILSRFPRRDFQPQLGLVVVFRGERLGQELPDATVGRVVQLSLPDHLRHANLDFDQAERRLDGVLPV